MGHGNGHGAGANGNSLLDDPEEALSRDRVKRASSQVIMAQDKKMKKKMTTSARGQLKKSRLPDLGNDSSDDDNNNNSGGGTMMSGGIDGSSPGRSLSGRGGPRSVSPKK